jgi:ABC-type multidrug transport system permease subunit
MGQFIINILNQCINGLGTALSFVLSLLPPSPFSLIDNSPIQPYLQGINYFVPISTILSIAQAWLVAVGIFYVYQAILRWIGAIE